MVGARGVGDDNLAYEVWDLGFEWPWQREVAEFPTARMTAEEIWIGARRIRFRRKFPHRRLRLRSVPVRKRKGERKPGEWLREFEGGWGMCSYPPEDLVIEGFGNFLQAKAKKMLSEDQCRVEPFTTSLLDGIDLRETIRNWHEGELYAREMRRIQGQVGAVVVIFDAVAPGCAGLQPGKVRRLRRPEAPRSWFQSLAGRWDRQVSTCPWAASRP